MALRFLSLYVGLIALRLFFALSKSYIHPDEMFQGSEIIVGDIFGWKTISTWEFAANPIRSIVPIYLFQSPLLYHLRMFNSEDSPRLIFYTLRLQQFLWTLVLDLLLYSISGSKNVMLLFASNYSTLTYQTHAFSNTWESIIVLATLCASQGAESSLLMGLSACLGVFTRISFVAFMIPLAIIRIVKMAVWDEKKKSWSPSESQIQLNAFSAMTFTALASGFIYLDTLYYEGRWLGFLTWNEAVYTVWNNLQYNTDSDNLAQHGLHPRYTHLINIVLFLGPAILLVGKVKKNIYSASMITGFLALSCAPHQEARFLLPCVVLFFAALRVPRIPRTIWILYIIYNLAMAQFMGVFHQCGVIPAALHIAETYPNASITWTKSYPAPIHLLGPHVQLKHVYGDLKESPTTDLYVAPLSRNVQYPGYELVYNDGFHVNLDDLDVLGFTVFKKRGLAIYKNRSYAV